MKLVIVGSMEKAWPVAKVPVVKDLIKHVILEHLGFSEGELEIGSGESPAGGVDIWAHEIADELSVPFVPFAAAANYWAHYKKRNQAMADWCTNLVRIKSVDSRTYGSGWTRDRATEQGKRTQEYTL